MIISYLLTLSSLVTSYFESTRFFVYGAVNGIEHPGREVTSATFNSLKLKDLILLRSIPE